MTRPLPGLSLGYLVPEFPGQTHAFFWREVSALEELGASVDIVSTTRPCAAIAPHGWTEEAAKRTFYLASIRARDLGALVRTGVLAIRRHVAVREALSAGGLPTAGRLRVLVAAMRLHGRAQVRGWSHVHVHSCAASALVALVASRLGLVTYSLTLHGSLDDYGPGQPAKWANARFALVITRKLEAEVRERLGPLPSVAIDLAPMGVRVDDLQRGAPYEVWTSGRVRLFSCGRLNVAKGHDNLIRALAKLVANGIDAELTIAGEDEDGGTGYRRTLGDLIRELDLGDRVRLLGAVREESIQSQLERAHVFVLASHGEPLGVAIMEAMAMGVPVVVGDGGGVRELVDDSTGVLVDPEDPDAIARGIQQTLDAPELTERRADQARRFVVERFSSRSSACVLLEHVGSDRSTVGASI